MKTVKYLTGIPRKPLPADHVAVHNRVRPDLDPARRAEGVESMADVTLGMNGFRAWIAAPDKVAEGLPRDELFLENDRSVEIVRCDCGWAPELAEHYRVDRP